jgi:cell division protein FtsZ
VTAGHTAGAGDAPGDGATSGGAAGGSATAGAGYGSGYGADARTGTFTSQGSPSRGPASHGTAPSAPEPSAESQAQHPAQPAAASYVPAPVAFVSGDEDDDDYLSAGKSGYDIGDSRRAGDGGSAASSRPEAARTAPEKIFDVSAPRRRPVVFEEDDDLDVPDFLK